MILDDFKEILEKKSEKILSEFNIDLTERLNPDEENYIKKILIRYLNFKNKTLIGQKYDIEYSIEINESLETLDDTYKNFFTTIENRIKNGKNIIPYQSKTVVSGDDNLFYQYGINHLHLSEYCENQFTKRSDYVLLYVVAKDTVYFLDIVKHPHGAEWIKSDYWEIYIKNWPQNNESLKLKGIVDVFPKYTPEEKQELAKHGVIFFNEGPNGVYMPTNPKATNNVPVDYNSIINSIINKLNELEKLIHNKEWIKSQGLKVHDNLNFKLVEHKNKIFLCEQKNENCCELTRILGDFNF